MQNNVLKIKPVEKFQTTTAEGATPGSAHTLDPLPFNILHFDKKVGTLKYYMKKKLPL